MLHRLGLGPTFLKIVAIFQQHHKPMLGQGPALLKIVAIFQQHQKPMLGLGPTLLKIVAIFQQHHKPMSGQGPTYKGTAWHALKSYRITLRYLATTIGTLLQLSHNGHIYVTYLSYLFY